MDTSEQRLLKDLGRSCDAALLWVVVFIALHIHWFVGGRFGFGDQTQIVPATDSTPKAVFALVVWTLFVIGTILPYALCKPWGQHSSRRLRLAAAWMGCALLVARGCAGLIDTVLRESGLAQCGMTGLTNAQITGDAHLTTYTIWSHVGIDLVFLLGGLLFGRMALAFLQVMRFAGRVETAVGRKEKSDA